MAFLILETASFSPTIAHVGAAKEGSVIRWETVIKRRGQDNLIPQIHTLMAGDYGGLEGIIITTGPGSFTGLRGGFAAAKGFCFALKIPLYGIDLFDLTYYGTGGMDRGCPVLIALESGRGEIFACLYTPARGPVLNGDPHTIHTQIGPHTPIIGTAAGLMNPTDPWVLKHSVTAYDLANLCLDLDWRTKHLTLNPAPFYVRPPDISVSKGSHS